MLIEARELGTSYQTRILNEDRRSLFRELFLPQYRTVSVLKELELSITAPGVTAILGRNGSGKTTLIKTLTGLLTPEKGQARILGFDPAKRQSALLRQIGVVFGQKKMLWPELSLLENSEITGSVYRIPRPELKRRSQRLLEYFDLGRLRDRPVKSLSLGESMKAEVFNVLLFEPRILFFDEPTIGLDIRSQQTMRAGLLEYLKGSSAHMVLTSHNTRDIVDLADEIHFLEDGKLSRFHFQKGSLDLADEIEAKLVGAEP